MRERSGFSMVEVVLVAVIVAMTAAIAAPRYTQFVSNQRIEAAARRITADLALAQRTARLTSTSRTVVFDVAGNKYQLAAISDLDRIGRTFETRLGDEPYGVSLLSVNFGGDGQIVFNGFGSPDTGGSLIIGIGPWRKTVTVDEVSGRARPNPQITKELTQ